MPAIVIRMAGIVENVPEIVAKHLVTDRQARATQRSNATFDRHCVTGRIDMSHLPLGGQIPAAALNSCVLAKSKAA